MSAPIRDAIIRPGAGDPLRPVAGVPLLVRTILALQRAGIERCTLVAPLRPPADPRIRCALEAVAALEPPADDALRVVVDAGTLIDATCVRALQARAAPGTVLEVEGDGARVRVAPGSLVARDGGPRTAADAGILCGAGGPAALLERRLLRALENPRDGWIDRLLHRRLSRPLTRLVLPTPITPNAVSLLGIALGVAGGLALGVAGAVVLAVLLLEASAVLDCVDGELARLRFAESRLGHWIDVSGDTLVHAALLGGVALRLARTGSAPAWPVLAVLGLGVLAAFAVVTWCEETETRRRPHGGWENRLLDGVLPPLTTRDWHLFVVVFAVAGRLDLLVPAAAVGAHVFSAGTLLILRRALRRTERVAPADSSGRSTV
jgi:phosphatidylglycerophosphate synthase